jgi:hypothetical protein
VGVPENVKDVREAERPWIEGDPDDFGVARAVGEA